MIAPWCVCFLLFWSTSHPFLERSIAITHKSHIVSPTWCPPLFAWTPHSSVWKGRKIWHKKDELESLVFCLTGGWPSFTLQSLIFKAGIIGGLTIITTICHTFTLLPLLLSNFHKFPHFSPNMQWDILPLDWEGISKHKAINDTSKKASCWLNYINTWI